MTMPDINYDILRRVAETASAYRYKDIWITVGPEDGQLVIRVHDAKPTCEDCAIFPIAKVDYGSSPSVEVATIGSESNPVDLLNLEVPAGQMIPAGTYAADAVFWSQSAVEKFMIPYYASVYGDQADVVVQTLLTVLKPAAQDGSEPDPAFAIAHLPGSEYVTLANEGLPHLFLIRQSGRVEGAAKR
ncbi:MAG TPA: hypothetical protein VGB24_02500 [Longimicrobium sp.]|jgi:hypothetical protein|uniref:hypothetical protein n=1 Tax=Longimicrobium sp. TaxID=2029185 RepID=UPI002EDAA2B5